MSNAGALRDLVQVYHSASDSALWVEGRRAYADAQVTGKRVSPASYAVNANEVTFLLRKQKLNLGDLIVWGSRTTMVAAVSEVGNNSGYIFASCAMVRRYCCDQVAQGTAFEGVLCEKYNKYGEASSYASNEVTSILIVPTGAHLQLGEDVCVGDTCYAVRILHDTADGAKQYEVWRQSDL